MIKKEYKLKIKLNKELGFNSLKSILKNELKQYGFKLKIEVLN